MWIMMRRLSLTWSESLVTVNATVKLETRGILVEYERYNSLASTEVIILVSYYTNNIPTITSRRWIGSE